MKTLYDNTDLTFNSPVFSSDASESAIDKQLNELLFLHSKLKKLEFYKAQLTMSLKKYMQDKGRNKLENENGKLSLISMTQHRLDKSALIELGVKQELIDLATNDIAVEQLRISVK